MSSSSETKKVEVGAEVQPSLAPIGDLALIAGYVPPLNILIHELKNSSSKYDNSTEDDLLTLATKILQDPLLQTSLADRVYQLMQQDLLCQQERNINYGSC